MLTSKEQSDIKTTMVGLKINRCNFTIDGFDFTTSHNLTANNYIKINRCNFTIDGFDFTTSHNLTANNYIWIKSIYQQKNFIALQNMDVSIEGNIMTSYDPMTLYVTNFDVDYYRTNQGFYILTQ